MILVVWLYQHQLTHMLTYMMTKYKIQNLNKMGRLHQKPLSLLQPNEHWQYKLWNIEISKYTLFLMNFLAIVKRQNTKYRIWTKLDRLYWKPLSLNICILYYHCQYKLWNIEISKYTLFLMNISTISSFL